jgi:hypothetical protein
MSEPAIEALLDRILERADLESERSQEIRDEMREHLLLAVEEEVSHGLTRREAIDSAAERFGLDAQIAEELNEAHAGWSTSDAILATALPVLSALVLRWLVYAPDGSALGWAHILSRPVFWVVALATLIIPVLRYSRMRYALAGWAIYWAITVAFVTGAQAE